jgi:hypothetical protein
MIRRWLSVMTKKIMAGRNVDVFDPHKIFQAKIRRKTELREVSGLGALSILLGDRGQRGLDASQDRG